MSDIPSLDVLHRFLLERSGVRGVLVHLDDTWTSIRERAEYPEPLAAMLGETAAAAALFTGHAKVEGRLSIQVKGSGALRTLFAECTHAGTLRGLAHWHDPLPQPLAPDRLGEDARLAITIESPQAGQREPIRYQGLVDLHAPTLAAAFERYFVQSEQLPTRLLLAANGERAAGLMLQLLPGTEADPEHWLRAQALFDTLQGHELLETDAPTLLYRLFHEESVRLMPTSQPLAFGCSCSRDRVGTMLLSLGREEAFAAIQGDTAEIICEFCNQRYLFDSVDMEQLFAGGGSEPASGLPQ
jgi:molecular chaperone Hsp33